ncbi:MAG: TonB-dependent receptor [Saprospiraceae bacterium]|nr:TonB-dependent receptor [Saprospiraceae bacterium]
MKTSVLTILCTCVLCTFCTTLLAQTITIKVLDAETNEPLIGACISIASAGTGDCTDADGVITLEEHPAFPFVAEVTYLGYLPKSIEITESNAGNLEVLLEQEQLRLSTVEVRGQGSRLKQELSLTVESLSLQEIQSTSEASFYDVLGTMREADMLTVSFGVKVVNTRGFNSSTPVRSLQLIDGVDNASPGLNYPLGNFVGLPELDVQGVDLVIGASSAFFGPGAFNGVVNMRTKSPFRHQGLDLQLKVGQRDFKEIGLRWAKGFKNKKGEDKLGLKFNASYLEVYDWVADNANPSAGNQRDSIFADNPGGYDAINRYGDETSADFSSFFEQFRHPGLNRYFRTGYWEEDLANYDSYNAKFSAGLHYKINPDVEMILSTNFGIGTTVMQLDNRLSLNDVWAMQNKFEIRKEDHWFVRMYRTGENAGDTYDIVNTAQQLQSRWRNNGAWTQGYQQWWFRNANEVIKALPGFPEIGPAPDFFYDFEQAASTLAAHPEVVQDLHDQARASQDAAFLVPGTAAFDTVFQDIISTKVSEGGSKYVDRSALYHAHAEYKFRPSWTDEITIGGNGRLYTPLSEGTIFIDTSGSEFTTYEYGFYGGIEKKVMNNRLKLNFAARVDKHENYNYLFSPAISANYRINPLSSVRVSLSSALRNPTLIDQYYYFRVGGAILLGNITGYEDLVTLESFESYLKTGLNPDTLVYFSEPPLVPERALAFEASYSSVFFNEKLDFNSTFYINRYEDFIGYRIGLDVPFFGGFPGNPAVFRFAANARDVTYTTGFSAGFTYFINQDFKLNGNYSWNKLFIDSDDPLIPAYNTPEHKFNLGLSGYDFDLGNVKHLGFGVSFRWVEGYTFESSPQFTGRIPAQVQLNASIGKGFDKVGIFKISGSNLLNRQQNGLYGGPAVGRFIFAQWNFSI